MRDPIQRLLVLTHTKAEVSSATLSEVLARLSRREVAVLMPPSEWEKHAQVIDAYPNVGSANEPMDLRGVGLCLVLGGDGTMLRAFHVTRDMAIPVAGINLGRVGFLTTLRTGDLSAGLDRLLDGDFTVHTLQGLVGSVPGATFNAANDIVVTKGDVSHLCSLSLAINGVTLFEVLCDGVVAAGSAGSSAYSLAAGGPLLGIEVQAYVITFVAPHSIGVRPIVAAPGDVLEITNEADDYAVFVDVDGQRLATLAPGGKLKVTMGGPRALLALLEGDSLYLHFRDRLL